MASEARSGERIVELTTIDGVTFRVSEALLSRAPMFAALFSGKWADASTPSIHLDFFADSVRLALIYLADPEPEAFPTTMSNDLYGCVLSVLFFFGVEDKKTDEFQSAFTLCDACGNKCTSNMQRLGQRQFDEITYDLCRGCHMRFVLSSEKKNS